MKKNWKEMKGQLWPYIIAACIVVLFFVCITHISVLWNALKYIFRVLLPVIIGFAVAYIINPFAMFNSRVVFKAVKSEKVRWTLSVQLALVLSLALLALLISSIIPQLISSIRTFAENLDSYVASLKTWLDGLNLPSDFPGERFEDILSGERSILNRAVSLLLENLNAIVKTSSAITGTATNVVMGLILAVYFLFDKERLKSWCTRFAQLAFTPHHCDRFMQLGERFNQIFASYITCELIDAAIVGIATYLFMLITGMEYSVLIAVVCGVTNLVPTFGPIVGFVFGGLMLLLVDPVDALIFVIFTIILQTIDGYIIKPHLFGDVLNVPGVIILIAIIIFGKMMGVIGIFLAIPLAAIIVYVLKEMLVPKAEKRRSERNSDLESAGR